MLDLSFTGETQELNAGLKLLQDEQLFREGTGKYHIHVRKSEEPGLSILVREDGADV